jgi:hypothetical protein
MSKAALFARAFEDSGREESESYAGTSCAAVQSLPAEWAAAMTMPVRRLAPVVLQTAVLFVVVVFNLGVGADVDAESSFNSDGAENTQQQRTYHHRKGVHYLARLVAG